MKIAQMVEKIKKGQISCAELVARDIAKIEENKHLNAVIEINPDAFDIAKALDEAPVKDGALYGIPILVKDNVNTADKMRTSVGSVAFAENIANSDAEIVRLLRKAGAVILGKTNMTEFANYMTDWRTSPMPNGYSSRGGKTMHPDCPDADPLGSSSGSAVAVAAGLCAAAIGSETYGSIIAPAQYCGVVGIKPTDGLVSKEGGFPISFTLDIFGPMTRCVDDAALVLGVIADRKYEIFDDVSNVRIGVCSKGGMGESKNSEWLEANKKLVTVLKDKGFNLCDVPDYNIDEVFVFPIMQYEFKHGINSYLDKYRKVESVPKNLQEIIDYNEKHADVALKYGQGNLLDSNKTPDDFRSVPEYIEGCSNREDAIVALNKYFDDNNIDVLFMTTAHYGVAPATGFPSMTIPIGRTKDGLPIGCCFIARRFDEETLMSVMKAVEKLELKVVE